MKILKALLFLGLILNTASAFAAVADHFNVTFSKDEVKAGEAIDLIIEVVDINGNIVKDYTGNIVGFSETDDEVELPSELVNDDGYTFTLSNEGIVKFENAVKFMNTGEQELSIYDTDASENIIGIGIINVNKNDTPIVSESIEIISPQDNLTIGKSSISVSGESKKNHKILIMINDKNAFYTTSNNDGIFEKTVDGLEDGENFIQAFILNSDDQKIGESNRVLINISANLPQFKKITLMPLSSSGEVEEGKNILVNVFATSDLTEVNIIVNDSIITLAETDAGVYVGNFNAPDFKDSDTNEYSIDVIMKDNLGHTSTEKDVANIKVTKVELPVASIKEEKNEEVVNETPETEFNINELDISGLKLVKLKNKSVLTWDKIEKADGYNVYKKVDEENAVLVETVKEPRYEVEVTGEEIKYQLFAVKAYMENGTGSTFEGNLSDATEIQTGPEMIILLILSLLLGFGFFMIKRRA
ncbi:MAG: hypothetical protein PHH06_02645 [Candidatus Gracilibacteria bacterium]|nr:hypothetical protein [Candidatus Gracilibacteria bacterium]